MWPWRLWDSTLPRGSRPCRAFCQLPEVARQPSRTVYWAETGLQALMRMTSWGHADITMTQSMSARQVTLSAGFDAVSRHSRSPVGSTGMFIHRLKDAGQTRTERSSISRALWRLSAQLA